MNSVPVALAAANARHPRIREVMGERFELLANLRTVILDRTSMPVILLTRLWPNIQLLGPVFHDTTRHFSRLTGKTPFMLKKLQEDDKAQPCRSIFVADPLLLLRQDRPLFG